MERYRSRARILTANPRHLEEANRQFVMRDGRVVAVAECGDRRGLPVFMFYGLGASRYFVYFYEDLARRCGLRLICPDRPGRGVSTHQENRSFMSWANDIEQIALQMRLPCFAMWGFSVGALHALACATYPPVSDKMLGRVVLMAPWAPPDTPGNRRRVKLLSYLPSAARSGIPQLWQHTMRRMVEKQRADMLEDYDGVLRPKDELYFIVDEEARRQGGAGFTEEFNMCCKDRGELGFALSDVARPVRMYSGLNDSLVHIQAARVTAFNLPNCDYVEVSYGDHPFFMKLDAVEYSLRQELEGWWGDAASRFGFRRPEPREPPAFHASPKRSSKERDERARALVSMPAPGRDQPPVKPEVISPEAGSEHSRDPSAERTQAEGAQENGAQVAPGAQQTNGGSQRERPSGWRNPLLGMPDEDAEHRPDASFEIEAEEAEAFVSSKAEPLRSSSVAAVSTITSDPDDAVAPGHARDEGGDYRVAPEEDGDDCDNLRDAGSVVHSTDGVMDAPEDLQTTAPDGLAFQSEQLETRATDGLESPHAPEELQAKAPDGLENTRGPKELQTEVLVGLESAPALEGPQTKAPDGPEKTYAPEELQTKVSSGLESPHTPEEPETTVPDGLESTPEEVQTNATDPTPELAPLGMQAQDGLGGAHACEELPARAPDGLESTSTPEEVQANATDPTPEMAPEVIWAPDGLEGAHAREELLTGAPDGVESTSTPKEMQANATDPTPELAPEEMGGVPAREELLMGAPNGLEGPSACEEMQANAADPKPELAPEEIPAADRLGGAHAREELLTGTPDGLEGPPTPEQMQTTALDGLERATAS